MTDLILASLMTFGPHRGGGFWFPIIPLLFLAFWVTMFVLIGRRWRNHHRHNGESVLAERFARGEITETEYRERRLVLRER